MKKVGIPDKWNISKIGGEMFNDYKYRAAWCPVCQQGWIEFVKDIATGLIYLCCNECEVEWSNPEDIFDSNKGTRFKYGNSIEPTKEEILSKGWGRYIIE